MWELLLIPVCAYVATATVCFTLGAILSWRQGETTSVREHELQELLESLVSHLDGATMEEDADEVFCSGCLAAYRAAREWLDKDDPSWSRRWLISMEDLDDKASK